MVLHKFALRGGKVPAATGMRAAGRPPKAGRRTSFAAAAAPPGQRPAGSPENPAPPGAAVFGFFNGKVFAFLRLMFFRRLRTFCGRDRTDSPSPERKAIGSFLFTLAACRFWAFAVGKKSWFPSPQGKAIGSFLSTLAACRFLALRWGEKLVPIPARASQWVVFIHPRRLSILGCYSGEEKLVSIPRKEKRSDHFNPPLPPVDFGRFRWGRIGGFHPRKEKRLGRF